MSESKIHPELYGIHGLNFAIHNVSPSRSAMFASHIGQRLVIEGADEKIIQTGIETELSKYNFSIKIPVNARIIKVIDRYPTTVGYGGINFNPESIVIYEELETKMISMVSIPRYASYHQYFGFPYQYTAHINQLVPTAEIEQGTVLADSPSHTENDGWAYGINLNMAFMSHPAVSEDAILISEDVLDRLRFRLYERREVEFGSNSFPLNLYGDEHHYKPFPDIGDMLYEDERGNGGLLMALRTFNARLAPVEMSIHKVCKPDYNFDKLIYGRNLRGRVIDIQVYHDDTNTPALPTGISEQPDRYAIALKMFYKEIIDTVDQIRSDRRRKSRSSTVELAISPELKQMLVRGYALLNEQNPRFKPKFEDSPDADPAGPVYGKDDKHSKKLNKLYRNSPLDAYRVEFVIEYEMRPNIGFKMTDSSGGIYCLFD